jgi:hypothetical protein
MLSENLNFTSLLLPTALADIELFKQQHQTQNQTHSWDDQELIYKLENCLEKLDSDIASHIKGFIVDFKNGNNIAPTARYIIESLDNTYSSCGINEDVIKNLIPFDTQERKV